MQYKRQFKEGHVLLEGIILIGILGILLALMMPTYAQCIKRTEEMVCRNNCQRLQKLYEVHLMLQDEVHSKVCLENFLEMQPDLCCPEGGRTKYEAGTMTCDKHGVVIKATDDME